MPSMTSEYYSHHWRLAWPAPGTLPNVSIGTGDVLLQDLRSCNAGIQICILTHEDVNCCIEGTLDVLKHIP